MSPIDYVGYFSLCDEVACDLVSCVNYEETIFCLLDILFLNLLVDKHLRVQMDSNDTVENLFFLAVTLVQKVV